MIAQAQPQLSRDEWQAVAIALNDAACGAPVTRERPGAMMRLAALVTGHRPRRPLADPRLEAIRSFVCATRRQRRPAEDRIPALEAHGFSRAQVDALALLTA